MNIDFLLSLTLNTCTNSDNASVTKAIVWPTSIFDWSSVNVPIGSFVVASPIINAASVSPPIIIPWYTTLQVIPFVNIPFPGLIGFLCIISLLAGSKAKAKAGNESVTRFIHNMWIGNNISNPFISVIPNHLLNNGVNNVAKNSTTTSPILLDNRNWITFNILSYIFLPSSTADTTVAKLSSVNITSAASFATSVPTIPIAQPMSAFFSAGLSLTPSPVIATTSPFFCQAFTILTLCSGDTLA